MSCGFPAEQHADTLTHDDMTRTCKFCGATILWGLTLRQRRAPFDPGTLRNHFITCPKVPRRARQAEARQ